MPATMSVVVCPKCGAKNRVRERRQNLQAVCGRCRTPLSVYVQSASGGPITLTDSMFTQILATAGALPVLVDCWAPWCGPCRMIAPSIDALAEEARGRYVVAKLNVDENPRVATKYNIASIPTLLIFRSGDLVERLVGLQPKSAIADRLAAHL